MFQCNVLRYASWICLHVCVTPPSWIPGGGVVVCVILGGLLCSRHESAVCIMCISLCFLSSVQLYIPWFRQIMPA